ncbi:transmembrane protein, putative [Bodo saltans]|uniref:Transmembrane protein, putative n=1 Tax=Bodo saltans TaxID=75058 RepID=A0A0S4J7J3_BODSA|nr:transmembrane protein, putative [Bodo saltans]|eukprot:CUG85883.1 transmembrane protein, putative [Bodo saltans]
MNISLAETSSTDRWELTNVTTSSHESLGFMIANRSYDTALRWLATVVDPPRVTGWIGEAIPLFTDASFSLNLTFSCSVAPTMLNVVFVVPCTGIHRELAGGVEASAKTVQIVSLFGSGVSGSSLGRLLATRSLVLCDADAALNGGVIDMGVTICAAASSTNAVVARSAIVSNLLLVVVVLGILTAAVVCWSALPLVTALRVFCFPSSLMPVLVIITPSTAASATFLFARLWSSACVVGDVLLGLIGLVLVACPCFMTLYIWNSLRPLVKDGLPVQTASCERVDMNHTNVPTLREVLVGVVKRVTLRRWKWRSGDADELKYAWILLLDFRLLWYATADSALLAIVSGATIIGGLGDTLHFCQGWSIAVVVLMCIQLFILLLNQPFTSLFACVHAALMLFLTCLSATFQVAVLYESSNTSFANHLWLVEAAAICALAAVGVSGVKALIDLRDFAAGVCRRLTMLRKLHGTHQQSCKSPASESLLTVELMPIDALQRETSAPLLDDNACDTRSLHSLTPTMPPGHDKFEAAEGQFWDEVGNAIVQDDLSLWNEMLLGENTLHPGECCSTIQTTH